MQIAHPDKRPLLVSLPFTVQTYDIDFARHVNNAVYVRWLEDLRTELLRVYYPLEKLMANNLAPIIHSTHIVYKKSIELFEKPIGYMWCTKIGHATMTVEAEIVVEGVCCATAVQRGVLLHIGTTKPGRVPPALREQFRMHNEGNPPS